MPTYGSDGLLIKTLRLNRHAHPYQRNSATARRKIPRQNSTERTVSARRNTVTNGDESRTASTFGRIP